MRLLVSDQSGAEITFIGHQFVISLRELLKLHIIQIKKKLALHRKKVAIRGYLNYYLG